MTPVCLERAKIYRPLTDTEPCSKCCKAYTVAVYVYRVHVHHMHTAYSRVRVYISVRARPEPDNEALPPR